MKGEGWGVQIVRMDGWAWVGTSQSKLQFPPRVGVAFVLMCTHKSTSQLQPSSPTIEARKRNVEARTLKEKHSTGVYHSAPRKPYYN